MALDPQVKRILDIVERQGMPDRSTLTPERARELANAASLPPGPATKVEDQVIPGPGGPLAVRIYRPVDAVGALGALVFFHGGGFVIGELDRHDPLCQELAVGARSVVVSVAYRLAPEHKFPAAVEDSVAATRWVHAHARRLGIDPVRIAVGGDSAGGNLATVVARLLCLAGGPRPVFQLLVYPVTDLRSFDTPSYLENATGMLLTRATMMWFGNHYLRTDEDRYDPRASPLAASDLAGLPPALILTAEHDPLRDEGEAYAAALRAAGVAVTLSRYEGMIHTFVSLHAFIEQGRRAVRECTDALAAALGSR